MKTKITLLLVNLILSFNAFTQYITTIPLNVNRMRYDSKRDVIFATVKGDDPNYANTIVTINPYTGKIIKSLFIGSEPTEFEFTSDSSYLYVCFDELSMIRKIDLKSYTIVQDILLDTDKNFGSMYGQDIATIPGYDSIVVVSRKFKNVSPNYAGIVVFSNGKKLPIETQTHDGPEKIESTGSNILYGYGDYRTVYSIKIDVDSGAYILSSTQIVTMKDPLFYKGLLLGTNGNVIDTKYNPSIQTGAYPLFTVDTYEKFGMAPDSVNNKMFFSKVWGRDVRFYSFNKTTLAKKDTLVVLNVIPTSYQIPAVSKMIRFGKKGLATTVFDDYSFSPDNYQLILLNNVSFVDTTTKKDTLHPNFVYMDTVKIYKYETVKVPYTDTLIIPIFSTDIVNKLLSMIKVYPNPTNNFLNVELSNQTKIANYVLTLYNQKGQLIYQTQLYSNNLNINLSNFEIGTYFLKISTNDNIIISEKSIIIN